MALPLSQGPVSAVPAWKASGLWTGFRIVTFDMGILVNKGFKIREQYIFTESIADTNAQMSDVKFLDPF